MCVQRRMFVFRWLSLCVNVCTEENVCHQMIIILCQHVCRGECLFSDDYHSVFMCVQRRMFVFRWSSFSVHVCAEENVCFQMIIIQCSCVCRGECLFSDDYHSVFMCVQRRMFVFRWLSFSVHVCAEENVCFQMIIIQCSCVCRGECLFSDDYHSVFMCVQRRGTRCSWCCCLPA